ncbi:hypothetical protein CDO52_03415 [Nocardiopsis gilva YIM 90087]|uniref:Uncharacterized protein n=1 Tax=Nocardiopsis gilva YIM 90087 TaxID=1235441 RepID=A0A223S1E7_9ACTN|nr:permease prefix domain 1-containing protein [Nocardiopsis gilva]ASU81955.1 hypothetical protein CDO52_03415 [Nocardiopsis gilva YIM 90087]
MSGAARHLDPVEAHSAELAGALRGPTRAKARMVSEIRDGLADTVEAHALSGVPYPNAVRAAVREFGTPEELAPSCQRELTIAQVRSTARTVLLTVPLLAACWAGAWTAAAWRPSGAAEALAANLAALAVLAALLAVAALAATGGLARRFSAPEGLFTAPEGLARAVAWSGTAAAAAMPIATAALAVVSPWSANWPVIALAAAAGAASHAMLAASARSCRQCARTPEAGWPPARR